MDLSMPSSASRKRKSDDETPYYRNNAVNNDASISSSLAIQHNQQPEAAPPRVVEEEPAPPARTDISEKFLMLEAQLCTNLMPLQFAPPISYIYNPLDYANDPHSKFVHKYCQGPKKILFLGMNPGPFGMVQTGVPFGEISYVKDWLKIDGYVGKPAREHPQRKVTGFSCSRREVSGQRFWNFFKNLSETPTNFFRWSFVHNYCPLVFMDEKGKNITPSSLRAAERKQLEDVCDRHIVEVVALLQVEMVVGIGKYAYERTRLALERHGVAGVRVEFIMHPSPVNPTANKEWNEIALTKISQLNLLKYFSPRFTPSLDQQIL